MESQFLYLDYQATKIDSKDFLCIYILEFNKHQVFRIYKPYSQDLVSKLITFEKFDNINEFITFVIKRDGKISLNIKL